MTKSESIAHLAEALSKAQGEMHNAGMDGFNPHFGRKYADLANIWDACREPLARNGLSVAQVPEWRNGVAVVHTLMMHVSGEWLMGELEMTPTKSDPQGVGSAITYARRYALAGFAGIAPEDDDGNAASGKNGKGEQEKQQKPANKGRESTTIGAPPLPPPQQPELPASGYITEKQRGRFIAICAKAKWAEEDVKKLLAEFGVHSRSLIFKGDYDKICGIVENGTYEQYLDFQTNAPAPPAA